MLSIKRINYQLFRQVNDMVETANKLETKQENVEPVSSQAYEAFLSKKEEKPKSGQAQGKLQMKANPLKNVGFL